MSAIDYEIRTPGGSPEAIEEHSRPADLEALRPLPRISVHAFCETDTMHRVVERLGQDRRMSKVNLRVTSGSTDAAANMFAAAPTPNLIILETDAEPADVLTELAPLAQVCDPSTRVIVIGRHNDISLYRDLIRNGISEYLVGPVKMQDLLHREGE